MWLRTLALWTAVALAAVPAAAAGPDDRAPRDESGIPTLRGTLALALSDAIEMGLENNLDVAVERYAPHIAYEESRIAWGVYDPEYFSEFAYQDIQRPNTFSLDTTPIAKEKTYGGFSGFRGQFPLLGSEYILQFNSDRLTTNSTVQALSPELGSSFELSFQQPLMRDLIWSESWTRVKTTRLGSSEAREVFRREVMDTVRDIEDSYWTLIATEEELRVKEKSLETALSLLDQTKTQYEVGVISKVDVVQAEAGVAAREFDRIVAENAYRTAQDTLIDRVLGPGLRPESTLEIEPTDRPEDYTRYEIDVEESVRRAFSYRPELVAAQREIERREVELKFAKNQRLPQLDAFVSYGNQGLGGEQNSNLDPAFAPAIPIPTRAYGDTFNNFFTPEAAEQVVAGVVLSIPLPNTSARHGVSMADLELRRARTSKRRLEQQIILDVRLRARNLKSAQEGIEAAERRRVAAEEQLRAERIRQEYGESTPFDVLLKEEDLVEAESEKIAALRIYRSSATDLDRAQGTILRNHNIVIDEVATLR